MSIIRSVFISLLFVPLLALGPLTVVASSQKVVAEELARDIAFQRQQVEGWASIHPDLTSASSWGFWDRIRIKVLTNKDERELYFQTYQLAMEFHDFSKESLETAEKLFQRADYLEAKKYFVFSINRLLYADAMYNAAHQAWNGEITDAQQTLYKICKGGATVAGVSSGGIATVISGGTMGTVTKVSMELGIKSVCNNAFGKGVKQTFWDTISTLAWTSVEKIISKPVAVTIKVVKELPLQKVTAPTIPETKTLAEIMSDFVRREELLTSLFNNGATQKEEASNSSALQIIPATLESAAANAVPINSDGQEQLRQAEEAKKKTEEVRIAAEQEAQKHQQEESLRRAQEEQRQAEEQRKARAVAPFSTLTTDYGAVEYGKGTTLRWSSSNTTACVASGGWNGSKSLSGSEDTGPLYSTQTFVLTCTGSGGSVSQHTSVSVSVPPSTPSAPTLTFSTHSGWVKYGQGTTLQWSSSNATSCSASGGWGGNKPLSGSENTGLLYSTQTFILTCTGSGGSISRDLSVGIQNAPEIAIVDSYAGTQGKPFSLSGSHFASNGGVTLHFAKPDGGFYPVQHIQADSYGKFLSSWPIPADAMPGNSSVSATDDTSGMQTASIGFKIIATVQLKGDVEISAYPVSGPPGTIFKISGKNFSLRSSVILRFEKQDIQYPSQQPATDENGNLTFDWQSPKAVPPGTISVSALDNGTGRKSSLNIEITALPLTSQPRQITYGDVFGPRATNPSKVIATIVGNTVYTSNDFYFISVEQGGKMVDNGDASLEVYRVLGYKITPSGFVGISKVENTGNVQFGESPKGQ